MYTCKQSLHESSCCKAEERHGLWSSVVNTVLVDYTHLCAFACVFMHCPATRGSERHTNLHQSFLHTSPSALWQVESAACSICFYRLEFIFLGCFFFNLVFGCGVTLWRVWGNRWDGNTVYIYRGEGNVVAYLQLLFKEIFLFDVHISVLCLLQLCTVKRSLSKMKFSRMLICSHCNDV